MLLAAQETAISAAVVRDLEHAMQAKEDRRLRRQFYFTFPLAVLVIGAGSVYLRERPAAVVSLSSPSTGLTHLQFRNPIGPNRRLARLESSVAIVEPSADPSSPRPSHRRVLIRLRVQSQECAQLDAIGGYCDGTTRRRPKALGDTLRLHWARPTLLSLTPRSSASMFTIDRDESNISTLIDAATQVLEPACVAPVHLSVQRPGSGRAELDTCPQQDGKVAWVSAAYSASQPPQLTFTAAQSFSTDATATRLRGVVTNATLQYSGASRSIGDSDGATFDLLSARSSGPLRTRIDGPTGHTAQGVASRVTVDGEDIIMSRYAQQRDVWLAITGLAISILAPIWIAALGSALRRRKES